MEKIILHSTNCPKCQVLRKKMEIKKIPFEENLNVDFNLLKNKGFISAPILQVEDQYMSFEDANKWINKYGK